MKFGFQENESFRVKGELPADFFDKLPENISRDALWQYECEKTADGCCLTPTFKDVPYRNAFVPEIEIHLSYVAGETIVTVCGRLAKSVRAFARFWFGALAFFEVFLLAAVPFGKLQVWYGPLLPLGMAAFGYLMSKIGLMLGFWFFTKPIRAALGQ